MHTGGAQLKFHSFLSTALLRGLWFNITPRPLYPQKVTTLPTEQEPGWTPESVWIFWIKYSRVSFCDGSFDDDSLLRHYMCRTGHSRLGGASLSLLKRPLSTQCASSYFPVCMSFLFCCFSAVLLSFKLLSFLMSSEPMPGPSSPK